MNVFFGNLGFTELNSYVIKFVMLTAVGVPFPNITSFNVYRSKNQEFPAVARGPIAVTASPGPHGTPPSIVEVDPANFPGLYELKGAIVDVDSKGPTAWRFVDAAPGTAEDTYVVVPYLLREAVLEA